MTNLRIDDIKTLETLSLDELDLVVGGSSKSLGGRWRRGRGRRLVCNVTDTTVQPELLDAGVAPSDIPLPHELLF